jgi:hypothetical protein
MGTPADGYEDALSLVTSFEAYMVVFFQVEVFWVVIPCSVVVGCQSFRGTCYHHHLAVGGSMDL